MIVKTQSRKTVETAYYPVCFSKFASATRQRNILMRSAFCKRPFISRTFFRKIEAKNQGCGLSTDTSVFGVLKNLINIRKTS